MKFAFNIFLLCVFTVSAFGSVAADLARASKKHAFTLIEAEQTKTVSFFDERLQSEIVIAVSTGGKMRMQTLSPFEAATIFDGGTTARYEKTSGTWRRLDSDGGALAKRVFEQIGRLLTASGGEDYDVSENGAVLTLVPKNAFVRAAISKIEIGTSGAGENTAVSSVKITDADSDTTELRVKKISHTQPDGIFDVSKPDWRAK